MAKSANPDAEVAALARRQHGIVCFDQLLAAGLGPSGIALRVRTGRLPRIHRGVYVGPHEVDFLWRSHRLIVETDGWETHRDRASFEADRAATRSSS